MKKKLIVILSVILGIIALISGLLIAGVDVFSALTSRPAILIYAICVIGGLLLIFNRFMRNL